MNTSAFYDTDCLNEIQKLLINASANKEKKMIETFETEKLKIIDEHKQEIDDLKSNYEKIIHELQKEKEELKAKYSLKLQTIKQLFETGFSSLLSDINEVTETSDISIETPKVKSNEPIKMPISVNQKNLKIPQPCSIPKPIPPCPIPQNLSKKPSDPKVLNLPLPILPGSIPMPIPPIKIDSIKTNSLDQSPKIIDSIEGLEDQRPISSLKINSVDSDTKIFPNTTVKQESFPNTIMSVPSINISIPINSDISINTDIIGDKEETNIDCKDEFIDVNTLLNM